MASLIREAPVGQLIRFLTGNRVLQYPEEKPDFKMPDAWLKLLNENTSSPLESDDTTVNTTAAATNSAPSISDEENQIQAANNGRPVDPADLELRLEKTKTREDTIPNTQERLEVDQIHDLDKTKSIPIVPRKTKDGSILVDWYFTDDADNPQNWSNTRRAFITLVICLYTFVVYLSSAIYTTSEQGVMERFGVNETQAALGLSLFVLG